MDSLTARQEWLERGVGELTRCATHPGVETSLRCTRCGTPICPKCLEHTPNGAQCARCARLLRRGSRGAAVGIVRALSGGLAGLLIAVVGGGIISVLPFSSFQVVPTLLLGLLVGEVAAALAGRPGGGLLALEAFSAALFGPIIGRAAWSAIATGGSATLTASIGEMGSLTVLLVAGAALLAGFRAGTSQA